eukprot:jgi/Mesen1/3466/ME000195S02615
MTTATTTTTTTPSSQPWQVLQAPAQALPRTQLQQRHHQQTQQPQKRIAFMFLTREQLPLAQLWGKFFDAPCNAARFTAYIHGNLSREHRAFLKTLFPHRIVPQMKTEWGSASLVEAERKMLKYALGNPHNERFVLLSESCAPLWSFSVVYSHFMGSPLSFVQSYDQPGKDGRGRYNANFLPEVTQAQWRKGSQWFEVDRELASAIVADVTYLPKFAAHCKPYACYCDEHYLATMLSILFPQRLTNRTMTWVAWPRQFASHPASFGAAEFNSTTPNTALLEDMRGGSRCQIERREAADRYCFLFSRKLLPETLEGLLVHAEFLGYA